MSTEIEFLIGHQRTEPNDGLNDPEHLPEEQFTEVKPPEVNTADLNTAIMGAESFSALMGHYLWSRHPIQGLTGVESFTTGIMSLYGADLNRYNGSEGFIDNVKKGLKAAIEAILNAIKAVWNNLTGKTAKEKRAKWEAEHKESERLFQLKVEKMKADLEKQEKDRTRANLDRLKSEFAKMDDKDSESAKITKRMIEATEKYLTGTISNSSYVYELVKYSQDNAKLMTEGLDEAIDSLNKTLKEAEGVKRNVNDLDENKSELQSKIRDDMESIKKDLKETQERSKQNKAVYVNGKFLSAQAQSHGRLVAASKKSDSTDV